jgi:16S rRNA (cytidine1402-2'-O)-methyltransferase
VSLYVIATPIGNPKDITLRATEILAKADVVIGEEQREVSKLLKILKIEEREIILLNEHSKPEDVRALVQLAREKTVALVSDCGTPGFCDPGADLVRECRKAGVEIKPVPGASSLMALLSVSGLMLREFVFFGFLPAENEARAKALAKVIRESRAFVLMDTPYRLTKLMAELKAAIPERRAVLGLNLTQQNEKIFEGKLVDLARQAEGKAEFVLMVSEV